MSGGWAGPPSQPPSGSREGQPLGGVDAASQQS